MAGKPVLERNAKTVISFHKDEFREKGLCDAVTMNLGDACLFSCAYCFVRAGAAKLDGKIIEQHNRSQKTGGKELEFQDVVIRRKDAIDLLKTQLLKKDGTSRFTDKSDNRIVFASTLVDPAANMELLRETAEACNLVFKHTNWQIRLLSKSSPLHLLVKDGLIAKEHHHRLIFGFSTGTLDDRLASAIESGTALVSKRLEALHWLQDNGFRTFGMICPSLPQTDYAKFSKALCAAIRVDRCEHVWAEVINARGPSLQRTADALAKGGFTAEAAMVLTIAKDTKKWEEYAQETFLAHVANVPPEKLRFLQYISEASAAWWIKNRNLGAVLIGAVAQEQNLTGIAPNSPAPTTLAPAQSTVPLAPDDTKYLEERDQIVRTGISASIAAAKALAEIYSYKDGILWKQQFATFEEFCFQKWEYRKAHAYRLLACGEFVIEVEKTSPDGVCVPKSENQFRPLLAYRPEDRARIWRGVVEECSPDYLSGTKVATLAASHAKELSIVPRSTAGSARAAKSNPAEGVLKRLRSVTRSLWNAKEIGLLIAKIEGLIGKPAP
jgi:DNA repair photolyase